MGRFQPAITINEAINRIKQNEYFLPAFQREFEWDVDRITNLFDSLMKGYPINSMLFWKVKGSTKSSFKFYKFLDYYVEDHHVHKDSVRTDNLNDFWAVLDGQQRLTSLYISLCGSYAYHEYHKSRDYSEASYPKRLLYLNISRKQDPETEEEFYDFCFLPNSDTQEKDIYTDNSGELWFKAGRILSLPANELLKNIKRYTSITDDIIEELLLTQKDSQYSFPLLCLLYPHLDYKNNDFHQDHTHPEAYFENLDPNDGVEWKTYNSIINLQMLDANENMSKNDMPLEDWVKQETAEKDRNQFLKAHLIPDVDLSGENIPVYFDERRKMLSQSLCSILE